MEVAMIQVFKSDERGTYDFGWLDTRHTFSFNRYYNPNRMGFRALRVINEDWIAPGQGFGTHDHADMEIVTYVLEGELTHRDSVGSGGVLKAGDLQRMTAGSGISHSEFNASATEPVHLYQIWLYPERRGLEPSYEQMTIPALEQQNQLKLVASPDGGDGSMTIRQDARIYLATLDQERELSHVLRPGRHAWLQVLRGGVDLSGTRLAAGDGAALSDQSSVSVRASDKAEVLLFDLN
jgi:redox-sensitive bicupin YhaK (pirin superfamily)